MDGYVKHACFFYYPMDEIRKKPFIQGLFLWRRNRDLNPGAVLPTYKLSKPAPSTAWVFLHAFV